MYYMVYVSSASHLMSADELMAILTVSRIRNTMNNVTGMLLYKDGSFMQVLEGEEAAITKTFDRIGKDSRHRGIIILCKEKADSRSFDGWSMGFRSVNNADLKDIPSLVDFRSDRFTDPSVVNNPHIAMKLLKTFYE